MLRKLKDSIKQALHFSNRESNGLLAIMLLIFLLVIAPKVYNLYQRSIYKPLDHSADIALLEKNLTLLQENAAKSAPININSATATQLQAITGITKQLALRVIGYRDKLGGFISLDQYKEIYHLSNRLQARLKQCTTIPAPYSPKKISLNEATFQALIAHPYISAALAKSIIAYRKKRGKFTTLCTIQKLPGYHPDWGNKIMPYLTL
ncbi:MULTISPECIES: ComEA family DNA-binding protein [unclassified Candidatus Cardinium]|uniref:ComEA family DNA-binding protein n=1 Tax=unclassified Candidatus Cardinium TaxID=2641185 RepID=UPI001FB291F9|nr:MULTISPECIES: helix-hairpin-helix domain-containing protein [unclassified Candidatus Cardinium]